MAGSAGFATGATVAGVVTQVLARPMAAGRRRARADGAAGAAVVLVGLQVAAGAVAVGEPAGARTTHALLAGLARRTDVAAGTAVVVVGLQVDAGPVAVAVASRADAHTAGAS